jgi:hypothetical protein
VFTNAAVITTTTTTTTTTTIIIRLNPNECRTFPHNSITVTLSLSKVATPLPPKKNKKLTHGSIRQLPFIKLDSVKIHSVV